MTEKQIKRRLIVTNILFWLGALISLGAIGHLDYLNEQRITYGIEEFWFAVVKGIAGLILMLVGMFIGRKLEFEDEEADNDENE